MIKHTDTLSIAAFHAYVDSQLTDHQYEDIEKRVVDSPETIVSLQNCLLINEKLQTCFNGPEVDFDVDSDSEVETETETNAEDERETEAATADRQASPSVSKNSFKYIPPEPTLSNITEQEFDSTPEDAFAKIDSLELHQEVQAETDTEIGTILPARDSEDALIPELNVPQLDLAEPEITQPEMAESEIPELEIPVLTHSAYTEPHSEAAPEADIDVDVFLKGINETHMIDNTVSPMSHESLSKDIFAVSPPLLRLQVYWRN